MPDLADRISRGTVAALDLAPFDDRFSRLSRQVLAGGASRFSRVVRDDEPIHFVIPVGLAHDQIDYGALVLQGSQAGVVWRDAAGMDHTKVVPLGSDTATGFSSLTLGGEQWMRFDISGAGEVLSFLVPPVSSPLLRSTLIDHLRARPGRHDNNAAIPQPVPQPAAVRFPDPQDAGPSQEVSPEDAGPPQDVSPQDAAAPQDGQPVQPDGPDAELEQTAVMPAVDGPGAQDPVAGDEDVAPDDSVPQGGVDGPDPEAVAPEGQYDAASPQGAERDPQVDGAQDVGDRAEQIEGAPGAPHDEATVDDAPQHEATPDAAADASDPDALQHEGDQESNAQPEPGAIAPVDASEEGVAGSQDAAHAEADQDPDESRAQDGPAPQDAETQLMSAAAIPQDEPAPRPASNDPYAEWAPGAPDPGSEEPPFDLYRDDDRASGATAATVAMPAQPGPPAGQAQDWPQAPGSAAVRPVEVADPYAYPRGQGQAHFPPADPYPRLSESTALPDSPYGRADDPHAQRPEAYAQPAGSSATLRGFLIGLFLTLVVGGIILLTQLL